MFIQQKKNPSIHDKVATCVAVWKLHLLWILFSIPIITIGASTSALFYSNLKLREGNIDSTKQFVKAFKENFVQATIIYLFYGLIGTALILLIVFRNSISSNYGTILGLGVGILCIPYSMSLIYVFAVQSKFINTVRNIIFYATLLTVRHFKDSLKMLLLVVAVVFLNFYHIFFNFITLLFGFGLLIYVLSGFFQRIFVEYINASEDYEEDENLIEEDTI